ncbi:MAG TPA: class I SAM-dependent methyltransferase [Xanthobacteraceae bacterium]|nr:class I SAM-dependent methyltransferase [Xanthobacteraceae bacterium]
MADALSNLPEECPIDLAAIAERRSWLLSYARPGGIGAEFGVFRGHFAAVIARELKPRKLFLVDPWTKSGERFGWGPDPYTNFDRLTTAEALRDTRHRMSPYESTCEIVYVEERLQDFARNFDTHSDKKLDFAYLDTSHTYEDTLEELRFLAEIVADDGVILGDDWIPVIGHRHHGAMRAVNEFLKQSDYQLVVAGQDAQWCLRRTPSYSDATSRSVSDEIS